MPSNPTLHAEVKIDGVDEAQAKLKGLEKAGSESVQKVKNATDEAAQSMMAFGEKLNRVGAFITQNLTLPITAVGVAAAKMTLDIMGSKEAIAKMTMESGGKIVDLANMVGVLRNEWTKVKVEIATAVAPVMTSLIEHQLIPMIQTLGTLAEQWGAQSAAAKDAQVKIGLVVATSGPIIQWSAAVVTAAAAAKIAFGAISAAAFVAAGEVLALIATVAAAVWGNSKAQAEAANQQNAAQNMHAGLNQPATEGQNAGVGAWYGGIARPPKPGYAPPGGTDWVYKNGAWGTAPTVGPVWTPPTAKGGGGGGGVGAPPAPERIYPDFSAMAQAAIEAGRPDAEASAMADWLAGAGGRMPGAFFAQARDERETGGLFGRQQGGDGYFDKDGIFHKRFATRHTGTTFDAPLEKSIALQREEAGLPREFTGTSIHRGMATMGTTEWQMNAGYNLFSTAAQGGGPREMAQSVLPMIGSAFGPISGMAGSLAAMLLNRKPRGNTPNNPVYVHMVNMNDLATVMLNITKSLWAGAGALGINSITSQLKSQVARVGAS